MQSFRFNRSYLSEHCLLSKRLQKIPHVFKMTIFFPTANFTVHWLFLLVWWYSDHTICRSDENKNMFPIHRADLVYLCAMIRPNGTSSGDSLTFQSKNILEEERKRRQPLCLPSHRISERQSRSVLTLLIGIWFVDHMWSAILRVCHNFGDL